MQICNIATRNKARSFLVTCLLWMACATLLKKVEKI